MLYGTPGYIAPEVLNAEQPSKCYTVASDIYALGRALTGLWGNDETRVAHEVLCLLAEMSQQEVCDRPQLADVCELLNDIRERLTDAERSVSIYILDCDDYLQAEADGTLIELMLKLKSCDHIRLYNGSGLMQDKLLVIRQMLMRNNLIVSDTVYSGEKEALHDYFATRVHQRTQSGRVYSCQYSPRLMALPFVAATGDVIVNTDQLIVMNEDTELVMHDEEECYFLSDCLGWISSSMCSTALPDNEDDWNLDSDEIIELETPNGLLEGAFTRSQIRF